MNHVKGLTLPFWNNLRICSFSLAMILYIWLWHLAFHKVKCWLLCSFSALIKSFYSLPQVTQLAGYFEPLIKASVGVASKLKDHQQQMTFLDQTKTLAESALQMLYAAKEGGGNPKARPFDAQLYTLCTCGKCSFTSTAYMWKLSELFQCISEFY